MTTCSAFSGFESFGCWMGNFSAIAYFCVQIPQIFLNYKRKTTKGFSPFFVIIRLFGLSFLAVNGIIEHTNVSLIASGILLVIAYDILLVQFCYFEFHPGYYAFLAAPLLPTFMSLVFPSTIVVTDYINAISQVACYIPFVTECIRMETTKGISLFGQHLNFLGSILGLFMCSTTCNCDTPGWLMHIISMLQSCIIYFVALHYNEMRLFDSTQSPVFQHGLSDLDQILQKDEEGEVYPVS